MCSEVLSEGERGGEGLRGEGGALQNEVLVSCSLCAVVSSKDWPLPLSLIVFDSRT